jgi:hypothetical protein
MWTAGEDARRHRASRRAGRRSELALVRLARAGEAATPLMSCAATGRASLTTAADHRRRPRAGYRREERKDVDEDGGEKPARRCRGAGEAGRSWPKPTPRGSISTRAHHRAVQARTRAIWRPSRRGRQARRTVAPSISGARAPPPEALIARVDTTVAMSAMAPSVSERAVPTSRSPSGPPRARGCQDRASEPGSTARPSQPRIAAAPSPAPRAPVGGRRPVRRSVRARQAAVEVHVLERVVDEPAHDLRKRPRLPRARR